MIKKIYNYIIYLISGDKINPKQFVFKSKNKKIIYSDIKNKYKFKKNLLNLFCNNKNYTVHKWHHYIPLYDKYFSRFVGKKVRILEIGVKMGGSLKLWRNYFGKKAIIYGIDINPECANLNFTTEKIMIGDQSDEKFLLKVAKEMNSIDIIMDDGSHRMDHIRKSLSILFPKLNYNGIYAIEDLHTAYWGKFQGGFNKKGNFFNLARDLIDDLHFDYHLQKLNKPDFKRECTGIHIYDSIVFLEKNKYYKSTHSKIR
jgi:23S rRNA U2552 (ribose-2'-O)-methylase RlmE/FtsJ